MENKDFDVSNKRKYDVVGEVDIESSQPHKKQKNEDNTLKKIDFTPIFEDLKKLNLDDKVYTSIRAQLNIPEEEKVIGDFDISKEDSISLSSYRELIDEKKDKGPLIITIIQTTVDKKPFFQSYSGESLSDWLISNETCPLNRQKIQSIYFYSIKTLEDLEFSFLEKQTDNIDRTLTKLFVESYSFEKCEDQCKLGIRYFKGEGVDKNLKKAAELFRQAAGQGLPQAQLLLGISYFKGEGVAQDLQKAAELFRQAADQGMAQAQFFLGLCYLNEEGVDRNLQKAAELFRQAADQGLAFAQYKLGLCYLNGEGVAQDLKNANELLQKAADQGVAEAQKALCIINDGSNFL